MNAEERKAIYCHELGHCFSPNQGETKEKRDIFYEVDSDTFAVQRCGISPYILERALAKTYEYDIKSIPTKTNLTQESLDRYLEEMKARKENVKKLIHEFEKRQDGRDKE